LPEAAAVWARVAVVVALLAGCSAEGTPIRDWTIDVVGGPRATAVTLPGRFSDVLPFGETSYTLRTTVALSPDQRGHSLSLVLDCFHGPLVFTVNGVALDDSGDGAGGAWRFVIPPALTGDPTLALAFTVHYDAGTMLGFGVAPRLTGGTTGDARSRRIATFNRYSSIAALCFLLIVGVLYGTLFLLDRSRSEYAAMLMYSLAVTNAPLLQLGVFHSLFGPIGTNVSILFSLLTLGSLLYFLHAAFHLGPVSRRWIVALCTLAPLAALAAVSYATMILVSAAQLPLIVAVNVYAIARMIRLARAGEFRRDARLMLASFGLNAIVLFFGMIWTLTGISLVGGLHPLPAGIAVGAALQALILSLQHADRERAVEKANLELQRQVAERSRELGDALARLAQQPAQPIDAGRTIDGRYHVIARLGAGGMGTVYRVERLSDHRHFALKTLRGRGELDQLARFAREAQIAAQIDHPNLVPVLDVGITEGSLFLVMPLVDGGSLEQQRTRFGDVAWARPLLAQIAAGLAALHERGIVHRDLKPANVLLSGGVARIADFGLSSLAKHDGLPSTVDRRGAIALDDTVTGKLHREDAAAPALTQHGDIFGTPPYMAPELEAGVHAVKPASDVFAFGLIACELVTGTKAFAEPPMMLRMSGKPIPPPDLEPIAQPLRTIVARCLDLDPALRPTAAELVAELAP
jgi:serine/threonine-protein kinase